MKKGRNQSISKEEGYLCALGGLLRLRVKNTALHRRMAVATNRDSRRGSAQMKRGGAEIRGGPERELQIPLAVQMNADDAGVKRKLPRFDCRPASIFPEEARQVNPRDRPIPCSLRVAVGIAEIGRA